MATLSSKFYRYHVGIDPGTDTGFAVWDRHDQRFVCLVNVKIHEAMSRVLGLKKDYPNQIYVKFEDARKRKWLGEESGTEKLQGAGSVKRDCAIWEDFLTDNDIPFESNGPVKGMTKWSEQMFKLATGWATRTSNHARDAAVLVFQS